MREDSTPSIVELTCQVCSKVFHLERSRVWNGRGKTCSVACAAALRRRVPPRYCSDCGTEIGKYSKAVRCKPCAAKERARQHWEGKEQVECPICSTMFYPTMKNDTYCSWECASQRFGAQPPIPNPDGYCLCGCGQKTAIAEKTHRPSGYVAGQHVPYIHGHHAVKNPGPMYVIEDRGFETPCWIWQRVPKADGYAIHKGANVHRTIYREQVGEIPEGMHVHHRCENRLCVNPDHLELMTPADHLRLHSQLRKVKRSAHGVSQKT